MSAIRDLMREQMLQTFLAEARDLVHDLDEGLRQMRGGDHSADLVGRLFRAAHSIKGSGGMFGLDPLVGFTHVVENLLDQVRGGRLAPTGALVADLQDSCDHIADLIEMLVAPGGALDAEAAQRDQRLRLALARHEADAANDAAGPVAVAPDDDGTTSPTPRTPGDGGGERDTWHVSVRFGADVFRYGINPLSFLRSLGELGELVHVLTLAESLPDADEADPECCHLGFEVDLRGDVDKQAIADVFEFVSDCSRISILPPHSRTQDLIDLIHALPESDARLGELLVQAGTLTAQELRDGLAAQAARAEGAGAAPLLGSVLVEQGSVAPAVVQAALDRQAQQRAAAPSADTGFIRVRADRLDELINLVGELVIAGAGASLLAECSGNTVLRESQAQVSTLMEDIRERALRLRMVPIGETFGRFHRVLRDIERELGKGIDLVVEGGDTELDKTVVEKLADPLMHLLRNAADHGIESPGQRLACGKPARGRITLAAAHASGSVVIEIRDDGAGLDRERIIAKAVDRGLLLPGESPPDDEVFALVFEAGFSTAAQVTNLSGRGVGMDVVRRNISELRGTIEIESPPGQGTCVRIRLPLTLAIIDGFLVGVGDAAFVLPLDRVIECIEMPIDETGAKGYLDLRGQALPLVHLRDRLGIAAPSRTRRRNVVVVDCDGRRAGFVVDVLLGEFQTVIKPLGPLFAALRGISGSTILGSGEVALILDVAALVDAAARVDAPSHPDRQFRTSAASTLTATS